MDDLIVKLLMAVLVGAVIGAEREFRTGSGLRTLTLICLGSALFTIYSSIYAVGEGDPRRIAAAVVTGVGFLGAGMVLRHEGLVLGLTTAASVWLVAALGMGIGMGEYTLVAVATVLVLIVLWAVPLYQRVTNARQTVTYEVLSSEAGTNYEDFMAVMKPHRLEVSDGTMAKATSGVTYAWRAYGRPDDHQAAMQELVDREDVVEFRVL